MATAWPALSASDVEANDFATTTVGDGLIDRDIVVAGVATQDYQEGTYRTTTSATYASLSVAVSWKKLVPDFADSTNSGAQFYVVTVEAKVSAGTGDIRLVETGGPTNGTAKTGITNTGDGSYYTVGLDVNAFQNTLTDFEVEGQVTGGNTLSVRILGLAGFYFQDTDPN